jgi:hypothetical protein
VHEHSRRLTLDANYNLYSSFYANGTEQTQISNYLQAIGSADVIPEHLDLNLRAFAQPVVTSNFGALTAGNRVIPGAYSNSYGYIATPDLRFNLGDFATSNTMPSYGQVFFTEPAGTPPPITISGLTAPLNTTLRSLTEMISSGPDFDRLNWKLVGLLSETAQLGSLFSEKSGIANLRYALDYEWSLLATGGYDAISDSIPLRSNLSGPVGLGGIGLTLGRDFSLQAEAGERYNSFSFEGSLRYELTPTSLITATAADYVQTPGGQLLNNLTGLTRSIRWHANLGELCAGKWHGCFTRAIQCAVARLSRFVTVYFTLSDRVCGVFPGIWTQSGVHHIVRDPPEDFEHTVSRASDLDLLDRPNPGLPQHHPASHGYFGRSLYRQSGIWRAGLDNYRGSRTGLFLVAGDARLFAV